MRDQDEETAPLRFGASRGDRKPLGQQMRDAEDAYWCAPQVPCIKCGDVGDLPLWVEYDEYTCGSCQRLAEEHESTEEHQQ